MSLADEISAGFAAASDFAGEAFTMANHVGTFRGVFRGENSPTDFDLQGYDVKTTNAITVSASLFDSESPPLVNERITKGADIYFITSVEIPDLVNFDIKLEKANA